MGSRYPNRPKELNMETIIGIRVLKSQREKLEEYAKKNKQSLSELMREAITIWLNMQSRS